MNLKGVIPPIPTPFRNDVIDAKALSSNCERWMRTGLRGLVVLGSNGEAPFLDDAESDTVIENVRACVPKDRLLIAGVARESTLCTSRAAIRAAKLGADAVLVRTPSFFKQFLSDKEFSEYYIRVADSSPVPIILYNFSALTGVTLSVETVSKLSSHTNIIGIKESSSDIGLITALIDETPDDFNVLVGSAPSFYASLVSGAVGGVLALACVVPEFCVQLLDLVNSERLSEARILQTKLMPLARLVTRAHGVAGLKAAMSIRGYIGGEPRLPLSAIGEEAIRELQRSLEILMSDKNNQEILQ